MASFSASSGAVDFTAGAGDFEETRQARVALQEIPGGDQFYLDLAGRMPLRVRFQVLLADSGAWSTLNAIIGQVGTLVVEGLDTHDAVLMSASRSAPAADGAVLATVEFVITDV